MTPEDYVIAWCAYVIGVLMLMWGWWQITHWFPWRIARTFLRALVAVFLLFPYTVEEGYTELAPGFLVWLLALMFEGEDQAIRSGLPLLIVSLGVCILACLADLLWQRRQQAKLEDVEAKQVFNELVQASRDADSSLAGKDNKTLV